MAYRLVYHPAVLEEDLPRINRNLHARIRQAIDRRLTTEPTYYGEPLRHRLKGFWKIRAGDYRIVYQIVGQEVWVLKIGHRKDVYEVLPSRLIWKP
ncbi:MAG: type II toxin-antitoxin system RelE/ParE family toxin [Candidatus Omnitrophica bacterium]|nr:type II toxin-antitoxin system RelE/ParE family toxin [Candidatus Omnitrophota bacterium]